jgi:hypothetical protein
MTEEWLLNLTQRIGALELQLADVRNSRAWKLMEALHRIKVRVSGRKGAP